ncbi:baculoviral IAP repeat-containing protein 3-like isoform X2 [Biomphalaria glabrata]|uniref:Baculoviral IAP repeat-containing protein 3-like isoform X2 n=1 Tax=Biomphalaria glabrata TaxID=6526 RepID=A0A9W3A4H4_BIOGL|nr:baculoviral IAP repeat-containing protein 3-like isoform X2 [Biomphalaria glabrata]
MYLCIHHFIVDQSLVYHLDLWVSHKSSHNYWIRLRLIKIKRFNHTSPKCFNMTPSCKGRLVKEVKKFKPFSKCYRRNESQTEEIQNNDVEVSEVIRVTEANEVTRGNEDSTIYVQELGALKNPERAESVHVFKDINVYENKSIEFLKSDQKLNGGEKKTHESLATFSLKDLFQFRQLKMKHHPFIYYNTVTHPAAVRGLSWSVFANEIYRLSTFADYPQNSPKSASLLSAQGFVYIGNGVNDRVMCFYCGKEKENWRPEDVIQDVHRLLSPDCPQVLREMSNIVQVLQSTFEDTINGLQINSTHHTENNLQANSSLSTENTLQINSSHPTENTLQINSSFPTENSNTIPSEQEQQEPFARSVQNLMVDSINTIVTTSETRGNFDSVRRDLIRSLSPTYSDLGIITERPKSPEYAHKIKRLQTFAAWPRYHHLTPDELVEAGFFSAGSGDCTRCFFCGGGLRNWEEEDDVWVEHARWFPRCYYLRHKMGQEFIDIVQDLHSQLDQITIDHIKQRLDPQSNFLNMDKEDAALRRDPAVNSVILLGFQVNDVIEIAKMLKQEEDFLSAKSLIDKLETEGKHKEKSLIIPHSSDNTQTDIDQKVLYYSVITRNGIRHLVIF